MAERTLELHSGTGDIENEVRFIETLDDGLDVVEDVVEELDEVGSASNFHKRLITTL